MVLLLIQDFLIYQVLSQIWAVTHLVPNAYGPWTFVSFSSCQRNLIKTFQIEGMIALIKKMDLIFS